MSDSGVAQKTDSSKHKRLIELEKDLADVLGSNKDGGRSEDFRHLSRTVGNGSRKICAQLRENDCSEFFPVWLRNRVKLRFGP